MGTGIVALTSGGSGSATAAIALGTATAYGGIDVYTRNFLFGADNISSVATLVINALSAHRKATIARVPGVNTQWAFGAALLQIQEHQALCQVGKIRDLVLQAIKGGTVTASTNAGTITKAGGTGATAPQIAEPDKNMDPTVPVTIKAGG